MISWRLAWQSGEQIVPPRSDPARDTGTLVLTDVTRRRNIDGVAEGAIKKLLVLEDLPGPLYNSLGFDGSSLWGAFTLTRILGTVQVEADGSAHFEAREMVDFAATYNPSWTVTASTVTGASGRKASCVWAPRSMGSPGNGTYAVMDGGLPDRPSPLYVREMQRYGII